MKAATSLGKIG